MQLKPRLLTVIHQVLYFPSSLLFPDYDRAQHYGKPLSMRGGGVGIIKHNIH